MPILDKLRKNAYDRAWKRDRARWLEDYKTGKPCADCGGVYPFYVMDFDHVVGEKLDRLSRMIRTNSREAVLVELDKCELVCSNCHRVRTYGRLAQSADAGDLKPPM